MPSPASQRSGVERRAARPRVLIAEDEILVALELEALLGELDWDVAEVVSHVDAILPAISGADCALLDVNLKGETCYDAARDLQSRHVPFAFVTGYAELPDCPPELANVPRLSKPFSKMLLGELLSRLIDPRQRLAC